MDIMPKDDMTKMLLFVFLGLIIAILVLGYHKSPQASPALGLKGLTGKPAAASAPTQPTSREVYPSNKRSY